MSIDIKISIKGMADDLEIKALQAVSKLALSVNRTLVLSTPVDTGRARSNWLVALNKVEKGTTQEVDKDGTEAQAKAIGVVTRYNLGDEINIANNLPYIGRLNNGHSKQSPAGFVQKAIQVAERSVTK